MERNAARYMILNYMLNHESVFKAELARELNLSMPTVLSNISDLIGKGVAEEGEEAKSTGGRRARSVSLRKSFCHSIGVNITANHVGMVLVNLGGEVVFQERIRESFRPGVPYLSRLSELVTKFCQEEAKEKNVLGIGISLPGIVNEKEKHLVKSHALQVENYSLKMMEQWMPLPVHFENDANAAMLAEDPRLSDNAVYLSLSHTLGGAVRMDGRLFGGDNRRAGEFGHMILRPGGKKCYCGKQGCADAYCSAAVLTQNGSESLENFMKKAGQDESAGKIWREYLENLAMLISNIRMFFDTDIILGGEVGGYLTDYMAELGEKILQYNLFDRDISYLRNCYYKKEASAAGAAKYFFRRFIEQF